MIERAVCGPRSSGNSALTSTNTIPALVAQGIEHRFPKLPVTPPSGAGHRVGLHVTVRFELPPPTTSDHQYPSRRARNGHGFQGHDRARQARSATDGTVRRGPPHTRRNVPHTATPPRPTSGTGTGSRTRAGRWHSRRCVYHRLARLRTNRFGVSALRRRGPDAGRLPAMAPPRAVLLDVGGV